MATITRKRAPVQVPDQETDSAQWQLPVNQDPRSVQIFEEPEPEQTEVDRVVEMMRAANGAARATVKVYKMDNGVSTYCESYQPSEFEEGDYSMLRDSFGAGKFKIILYGEHPESGKYAMLAREMVSIAENKSPKRDDARNDSGLQQVIETIARGQDNMLKALMEMKSAPQKDPMEELQKLLLVMTTMRTAIGIDNQQPKQSPIGEVVAAMREMRAAASELMPDGGKSETDLTSMLPQVLDIIKSSTQNANQNPNIALPQIAVPQSIQNAPIQQPENDVNPIQLIQLRGYLQTLIGMAAVNGDPQIGADLVIEKLPDELVDLMHQDNWLDLLALVAPDVKQHQEWFAKVRALALEGFEPEESPGTGQPG